MNKRINKNIFKFSLAAVILGITVVGGIFALRVQATRNTSTMPDIFYSEGASVRVTENDRLTQMRFHMVLENNNENYAQWFDGIKAKKGVETGIICMSYDEYRLRVTEQCKFQLENLTALKAAKTVTTNGWEKNSGKIVSYAYLNKADIPTTSGKNPYNQEMIVRGYIKDKAGVVYTEPIIASMSDVAYKSQDASVKNLSASQKAIVKETYMKDHAITIIPLTGAEKVGNYRYGTSFSSISNAVLFTDEKRTQLFSDAYVTEDIMLYSATQAECNLGLDQLNGITYDEATKSIDVVGNTEISVKDDWFSAQIQGADGIHDFELSVTYGGMEKYAQNGGDGFIGIELNNTEGQRVNFDLVENNKDVYKARTTGAYKADNGWTKQRVTEDLTVTLRRVGKQYTMSYGEETWYIDSADLEKAYKTTAISDLRFYANVTKGIIIKDWKFTNLDKDSTEVSQGLAFYARYTENAMDEGAYTVGTSNGDWSASLNNAKAQKDFVVSWNMKSAQKANLANGTVAIRLTNPETGKSVKFALQHAYENAGRGYIYHDSMNYIKENLHSYKTNALSQEQWNLKLVRKADAYYLTLNGEKLWVGKATCMMNEVMIGDILGETVDVGFETTDWNVQDATWSVSTNEADINAAVPDITIDDGLAFYPMYKVGPLDPTSYNIEGNQVKVHDDWFSAQILEANRIKDFEFSVTFSGMANYKNNGGNGKIGISFQNNDDKALYFDLYEQNEEQYYARLTGAYSQEKGKTKQTVTDEITIKLRRVGQKYTLTYGTESWSFYASKISNASGSMKEQFAITEIHDLRLYAAITGGVTVKNWNFTNLDDAPKSIADGLDFLASGKDWGMVAGAYVIDENSNEIDVKDDWFTAQVVDAEGVQDFELSVTFSGTASMKNAYHMPRLGISFKNSAGKTQYFRLDKSSNKEYLAKWLMDSTTYKTNDTKLTSSQDIDEITLKLKRIGSNYTFTYGTEVWEIAATDLLDGTNSIGTLFGTEAVKDLRIFANLTSGVTIKSWNFTSLEKQTKIDEGLKFYAHYSNNSLDAGAYTVNENHDRIKVSDDWFSAQVTDADRVKDFEISVTYSGVAAMKENARLGIYLKNSSGQEQEFRLIKKNNKDYTANLLALSANKYTFTNDTHLSSTQNIDEITVTLKRVGSIYTITYGTQVWKFRAAALLDGTKSLGSMFKTEEITDLRIIANITGGVTIKSWSFTNYDDVPRAIDDGLNFLATGKDWGMDAGAYTVNANSNKIEVKDDWFSAQVADAQGVKDFELSVTYSGANAMKAKGRMGISFENRSGQVQFFRLDKNNNKDYTANLVATTNGNYTFSNATHLTSTEDIDKVTVTLKRIGSTYTFTYGTEVWEFSASDLLDGANSLDTMFATQPIEDLRIIANITGGLTIESWSFTDLDSQ